MPASCPNREGNLIFDRIKTGITKKVNPEYYWNNKYEKATVTYSGRNIPKHGNYKLDVRNFFTNPLAAELQEIIKTFTPPDPTKPTCHDQLALECLSWVIDNINYVSDKSEFGLNEFWCYPSETLHVRKGDCDDQAILLANLMEASEIPNWKTRLTAGEVEEGGHAYVTYYCGENDQWVALDCTYYPTKKPINQRPDYKDSRIYKDVWFSWNRKYAFFGGTKQISTYNSRATHISFYNTKRYRFQFKNRIIPVDSLSCQIIPTGR